jgi:hypothetical protein
MEDGHWKLRASKVNTGGVRRPAIETVGFTKMAPFEGPYWTPVRTPTETGLAAARFVRDHVSHAAYRGLCGLGHFTAGDGGQNDKMATTALACCQVARWSDDPQERREALAIARRLAWRIFLEHKGRVPVVYKGNPVNTVWLGYAYLAVYDLTKDERFKEAALDYARALAAKQQGNGGWRDLITNNYPGGWFGPSEFCAFSGESVMWYLGRLRKEFGTREFVDAEAKARQWVLDQGVPAMTWQNTGHHSLEMLPIQDSVAPHALSFAIWLLDLAEGPQRDLKLAVEIARQDVVEAADRIVAVAALLADTSKPVIPKEK